MAQDRGAAAARMAKLNKVQKESIPDTGSYYKPIKVCTVLRGYTKGPSNTHMMINYTSSIHSRYGYVMHDLGDYGRCHTIGG